MTERWTDKSRGFIGPVVPGVEYLSQNAGRRRELGELDQTKIVGPQGEILRQFGQYEKVIAPEKEEVKEEVRQDIVVLSFNAGSTINLRLVRIGQKSYKELYSCNAALAYGYDGYVSVWSKAKNKFISIYRWLDGSLVYYLTAVYIDTDGVAGASTVNLSLPTIPAGSTNISRQFRFIGKISDISFLFQYIEQWTNSSVIYCRSSLYTISDGGLAPTVSAASTTNLPSRSASSVPLELDGWQYYFGENPEAVRLDSGTTLFPWYNTSEILSMMSGLQNGNQGYATMDSISGDRKTVVWSLHTLAIEPYSPLSQVRVANRGSLSSYNIVRSAAPFTGYIYNKTAFLYNSGMVIAIPDVEKRMYFYSKDGPRLLYYKDYPTSHTIRSIQPV